MKYEVTKKITDELEIVNNGFYAMPEFKATVYAEMTYSRPAKITADPYYSEPAEDDFEIVDADVEIINYGVYDDGEEVEATEEQKKIIKEKAKEWIMKNTEYDEFDIEM